MGDSVTTVWRRIQWWYVPFHATWCLILFYVNKYLCMCLELKPRGFLPPESLPCSVLSGGVHGLKVGGCQSCHMRLAAFLEAGWSKCWRECTNSDKRQGLYKRSKGRKLCVLCELRVSVTFSHPNGSIWKLFLYSRNGWMAKQGVCHSLTSSCLFSLIIL